MAKRLIRKYRCNAGHEWTSVHRMGEAPLDDCPHCGVDTMPHEEGDTNPKIYGKAPGMKTNVSRAADFTSKMLEEDYGIPTSMQVDNAREGDSYVKMPSHIPQAINFSAGKEVAAQQLATARSLGSGIGPGEKFTGLDYVKGIPDPRKTAQFMGTKD